jgi:amidase
VAMIMAGHGGALRRLAKPRGMRVQLVAASLALTVIPALPNASASGGDCLAVVHGVNIVTSTVPQLDAALARHRITSRQLTLGYLARIKAFDHGGVKVNAIRAFTKDALAQADASDARRRHHKLLGPLDGIPVLLKDNVGTRDAPTTAGSIAFAGNIPKHEATIVTKLRNAGAVILAKTNLSEFANWVDLSMPNGYSSLGGQVVNPFNNGDPSGSSSGSGAGETLGYAALAIGTETSGSILSPSDVESIVGIKPTVGLVSRAGVIPLAQSFDTAGPMTRTVTDAAYLLQTLAGRDPKDAPYDEAPGGPPVRPDYLSALKPGALRGARLGYSTNDIPSGQQGVLFNRALADLRKAGATLVETDTLSNTANAALVELGVIPNEFKYGLNNYLATEAGPGLPIKNMNDLVLYNQQHTDKVKYGQKLIIASDATPGVYDEPSAIASRTATIEAARYAIDSVLRDNQLDAYLTPGASYANIGAAAGYPTVIVPAGLAGATPMGLGFLGSAWTERSLIGLAYDYERVSHRRQAPTSVNPALLASVRCR